MYATIQDIQNDWKKIKFTSSGSIINEAKVTALIKDETAYINAWISGRYVVPILEVSSPDSFTVLKRICIFRVSERIKSILEVKNGEPQRSSDEKQSVNLARTPNADLRDIQTGKMQLSDAIRSSNGMGSFNADTCQAFEFDVNKQQW